MTIAAEVIAAPSNVKQSKVADACREQPAQSPTLDWE
jgi:hypothetical protein